MPDIYIYILYSKQSIVQSATVVHLSGSYTHYYTLLPLIATLVALLNILFVAPFVDTYNTVINVDSGNTLCLKMQNQMRI